MEEQANDVPDPRGKGPAAAGHQRRRRYPGKYPRFFEDKYKEKDPGRFPETVRKVLESGKTPAGTHRAIMLEEVISVLAAEAGEVAVDCTLGYGGHAEALLGRVLPGGRLIGLDQDPFQLPRTESRLRAAGFGGEVFVAVRANFAGLAQALNAQGLSQVDLIVADLGVSSMQLDDPGRGFSLKDDGPLDMRMNPSKGQSAANLLRSIRGDNLTELLRQNADEPFATLLGSELAGSLIDSTVSLADRIRAVLSRCSAAEREMSVRRTFQALRVAVNDEFSVLEALLRQVPYCLRPGGRVAILSFHSGEDRRVKKAFASGRREGIYEETSAGVIRPSPTECRANPRCSSAKLRWARRASSV